MKSYQMYNLPSISMRFSCGKLKVGIIVMYQITMIVVMFSTSHAINNVVKCK